MKVLITPILGKRVKDTAGYVLPVEGRYYSYGPYWIRAKNKGLIEVQDKPKVKIEVQDKPKTEKVSRKPYRTSKNTKEGSK